jgi:hypothetical protein
MTEAVTKASPTAIARTVAKVKGDPNNNNRWNRITGVIWDHIWSWLTIRELCYPITNVSEQWHSGSRINAFGWSRRHINPSLFITHQQRHLTWISLLGQRLHPNRVHILECTILLSQFNTLLSHFQSLHRLTLTIIVEPSPLRRVNINGLSSSNEKCIVPVVGWANQFEWLQLNIKGMVSSRVVESRQREESNFQLKGLWRRSLSSTDKGDDCQQRRSVLELTCDSHAFSQSLLPSLFPTLPPDITHMELHHLSRVLVTHIATVSPWNVSVEYLYLAELSYDILDDVVERTRFQRLHHIAVKGSILGQSRLPSLLPLFEKMKSIHIIGGTIGSTSAKWFLTSLPNLQMLDLSPVNELHQSCPVPRHQWSLLHTLINRIANEGLPPVLNDHTNGSNRIPFWNVNTNPFIIDPISKNEQRPHTITPSIPRSAPSSTTIIAHVPSLSLSSRQSKKICCWSSLPFTCLDGIFGLLNHREVWWIIERVCDNWRYASRMKSCGWSSFSTKQLGFTNRLQSLSWIGLLGPARLSRIQSLSLIDYTDCGGLHQYIHRSRAYSYFPTKLTGSRVPPLPRYQSLSLLSTIGTLIPHVQRLELQVWRRPIRRQIFRMNELNGLITWTSLHTFQLHITLPPPTFDHDAYNDDILPSPSASAVTTSAISLSTSEWDTDDKGTDEWRAPSVSNPIDTIYDPSCGAYLLDDNPFDNGNLPENNLLRHGKHVNTNDYDPNNHRHWESYLESDANPYSCVSTTWTNMPLSLRHVTLIRHPWLGIARHIITIDNPQTSSTSHGNGTWKQLTHVTLNGPWSIRKQTSSVEEKTNAAVTTSSDDGINEWQQLVIDCRDTRDDIHSYFNPITKQMPYCKMIFIDPESFRVDTST